LLGAFLLTAVPAAEAQQTGGGGTGGAVASVSGTGSINCTPSTGSVVCSYTGAAASYVSKTSNYSVLSADSNTTFDNGGAASEVDFALPAVSVGLHYCFVVAASQTVKVIAGAGATIALGTANSTVAGNVTGSLPSSALCLGAINGASSQWVINGPPVGAWTLN